MSRTVYVNGEYLPEEHAKISVFDRGFLMADAVYEVTSVLDGKLCDYPGHVARLHRSLGELKMRAPVSDDELLEVHRNLVARNSLDEGVVYLQVTRGAADRDFAWPKDAMPGIVLFTQEKALEESGQASRGIRVVTVPDLRWGRRDIKTVQLLYPSLAKMEAKSRGVDDAWMLDPDGFVTEGTSNNAYIVTRQGTIVTRHKSTDILHGITRAAVLELAEEAQMTIEERPFSPEEAVQASEAFITAASTFVCPVVEIDGSPIGEGVPGPVARRLREIYLAKARETAI
ncbi:MAG: D-amino-acid transaminase [Paracoccaceae bacterium]